MAFGFDMARVMKNMDYVYYERLKTDSKRKGTDKAKKDQLTDLYKNVKNLLSGKASEKFKEATDPDQIADYFQKLARRERDKERRMFDQVFHVRTKWDTSTDLDYVGEEGKHIIWALNMIFNYKEAFQRFYQAVLHATQGKSTFAYFGNYFDDELEKLLNDNNEPAVKDFYDWVDSEPEAVIEPDIYKTIYDEKIRPIFQKAVEKALERVYEADIEHNLNQPELKDAYKKLKDYLPKANNNALVSGFLSSFSISKELKAFFTKTSLDMDGKKREEWIAPMRDQLRKELNNFKVWRTTGKQANQGIWSKAGKFEETITRQIIAAGLRKFKNDKNINFEYDIMNLGGNQIKFDTAIAIGNANFIQKARATMATNIKGVATLGESAQAANKINKELRKYNDDLKKKGIPEGFMVYVNEKLYNLDNFKDSGSGFSAGSARTMENLLNDYKALNLKFKHFLFYTFQLIKGTVGHDEGLITKEDVSAMFARAISSFLFDDYKTIGQNSTPDSSIHVFVLNDLYIPLSVFFQLLSNAFSTASNLSHKYDQKSVIKVDIKVPQGILYPNPPYGWEKWKEQRQDALVHSTVQYHFLKGFKQILDELDLWRGGKGPVIKPSKS